MSDLKTSRSGLSTKEAEKRLRRYGENKIPEKKKYTRLSVFLSQFRNALMYILVVAGAVSFVLGEVIDATVIFITILINAVIGYYQEYKAQDALAKLKQVISLHAFVIRDGQEYSVDAIKLVPGDIIVLRSGEKIPADGRIISAKNFQVNEASLTGESMPVTKQSGIIKRSNTALADRDNMVFSGTMVTSGEALVVVTDTGTKTEIGNIAELLHTTEDGDTPLQKKLAAFSKWVGIVSVFLVFIILVFGLLSGRSFTETFLVSVALAVAAIPEGLVLSVTVILAIGMQQILSRKGLVRRLSSAETLGSTSVICTDKTGTLTEGNMRVVELITVKARKKMNVPCELKNSEKDFSRMLEIGMLSNDVILENPHDPIDEWRIIGKPTERALFLAGADSGCSRDVLLTNAKVIDTLSFTSERKYRVGLHEHDAQHHILFITGAPEKLMKFSGNLTDEERKKLESTQQELSRKGLRLIGVGSKLVSKNMKSLQEPSDDASSFVNGMSFLGMFALRDVLRPSVKETIVTAERAGIKIVMITGDNTITAQTIANDLGLKVKAENVCDGEALSRMSDRQLRERIRDLQVFARVTPKDKLRIVKAWQSKGE
ncbi:MAG TPA: HAD-IC family P-type ATPase, partial [Patescibacteria group bacterium]|nr:HAD-IC family P-type ATPase [Patescibacteria group bacterium]